MIGAAVAVVIKIKVDAGTADIQTIPGDGEIGGGRPFRGLMRANGRGGVNLEGAKVGRAVAPVSGVVAGANV